MYFKLLPDGYVEVNNNGIIDYLPRMSCLVKKRAAIYVATPGINNALMIEFGKVEGAKCEPVIQFNNITELFRALQTFFNPNLHYTMQSIIIQQNAYLIQFFQQYEQKEGVNSRLFEGMTNEQVLAWAAQYFTINQYT